MTVCCLAGLVAAMGCSQKAKNGTSETGGETARPQSTDDGTDSDAEDTDTTVDTAGAERLYAGPCRVESKSTFEDQVRMHKVHLYYYDDHENLLRIDSSNELTGTTRHHTYEYDEDDRLISEVYDWEYPGVINTLIEYTYTAEGTLETRDEYRDEDEIGEWSYHQRTTYDADGNVLAVETDRIEVGSGDVAIDGVWNNTDRYTYDDDGHLLVWEQDNDADGRADGRTVYTYDAEGNPIREEQDRDGDGDPEVTRAHEYTYDDRGNVLTERYDDDADGVIDAVTTRTYDEASRLLTESEDTDADGAPDNRTTNEYDPAGNLILQEEDRRADGTIDIRIVDQYNEAGQLLRHTEYYGSEEPALDIERGYDDYGNLLQETTRNDRSPETTVDLYSYDCWVGVGIGGPAPRGLGRAAAPARRGSPGGSRRIAL